MVQGSRGFTACRRRGRSRFSSIRHRKRVPSTEVGMSMKRMLVGAALAAAISGGIVSATPGSATTSPLLGRATFEAFDVSRRVKAPQSPDERDGGRTLWKVKAEA